MHLTVPRFLTPSPSCFLPAADALLPLLPATLFATVIAALAISASPASELGAPSLRVDGELWRV
jgi:hypothetical protein